MGKTAMGGTGSADACRRVNEHFYVERLPAEHMDSNTQEFSRCPFKFVHGLFEGKDDQAVATKIGGRPCVFARGGQASQLFYDHARQTDAIATDAAPECVQALLGKGTEHRSVALLQGEEFIARKTELMRAFSNEALAKYWEITWHVMQKYVESWVKRGNVLMAKELDDLAFEISARCFIGAKDPAHVHKLRTIAGGASVLDVTGDPAVSAAVRVALIEMIDEEMEQEANPSEGGRHALDFMLEGGMELDDMKIELCHFLLKGRDSLGRALKCFALALTQHDSVKQKVEEEA